MLQSKQHDIELEIMLAKTYGDVGKFIAKYPTV